MQNSSAPGRRDAKNNQESQAGHTLGKRVLAPGLEHGYQSNEKYCDGTASKNLHQHDLILL